jgi:MFS family permease
LRPILGSIYTALAYVGTFGSAWFTFVGLYLPGDWAWRFPSIFQIVGPVYIIIVVWFCPESPRWLVKAGQREKALGVLAKLHANGDEQDGLVQFEITQIDEALAKEEIAKQSRYTDFLRTSGNRRRLFTLIILAFSLNWMGNGIIT